MLLIKAILGFFAFGLGQWAVVRLVSYFYHEVLAIESGLMGFLYLNIQLAILTGPVFWMWDLMKPVSGLWWLLVMVWVAGCYAGHRAAGLVLR